MLNAINLTSQDIDIRTEEIRKRNVLPDTASPRALAYTELLQEAGFDGVEVQFRNINNDGVREGPVVESYFVAFEPTQVKSSIGNAGEFSATDPNMLRQEAVPAAFYSALSVEVGKLTIKSASADSWKQQIKGLIAKGVIKEREVFWSGLDNWLNLQEGKITKEQVQAFLAAGGVKVELTRLEDGKGKEEWTFDGGDIYETEREAEEEADSYSLQQAQDRFDGDSSINDSYLLMREGETIETFYDEDEARQALAELEDSENASIEERYEIILEGNSYGIYGDRIAAQEDANNVINDWADAIRRIWMSAKLMMMTPMLQSLVPTNSLAEQITAKFW